MPMNTFNAVDQVQIYYETHIVKNEKARVVIAHGIGEHSGRYRHVVKHLNEQGYSVWVYDHRGHGQSHGKRGHIDSIDQYMDDLYQMIEFARKDKSDQIRLFLLGHSMGGMISLYFASKNPDMIDGIIVSSPGLGPADEIPLFKRVLANTMSRIWPSFTEKTTIDPNLLSHDKDMVKNYIEDDTIHNRVTARWYTEFMQAVDGIHQMAAGFKLPILMQVAGQDYIVSVNETKRYFNNLTVVDKDMLIYDKLYHEIYNETPDQRQKVLMDLVSWLDNHSN